MGFRKDEWDALDSIDKTGCGFCAKKISFKIQSKETDVSLPLPYGMYNYDTENKFHEIKF